MKNKEKFDSRIYNAAFVFHFAIRPIRSRGCLLGLHPTVSSISILLDHYGIGFKWSKPIVS